MKTILSNLTLVCTIAILAISCGSNAGNDPVKIAVKCAEAHYEWDLKTCQQLMGSLYEGSDLQYEQKLLNEEQSKALRTLIKSHKYSVKYDPSESEIGEDEAMISLQTKTDIDKNITEQGRIFLQKVDGNWCVKGIRTYLHPKTREELMSIVQ